MQAFLWFFKQESAGGLLLLLCAVIAMILANSPIGTVYEYILHTQVTLGFGTWSLSMSLLHWVNDGIVFLCRWHENQKRVFIWRAKIANSCCLLLQQLLTAW